MEKAIDELKADAGRIQVVWEGEPPEDPRTWPEIAACERRGRVWSLTVTENAARVVDKIKAARATFFEELPLSLEDWFIASVGRDVQHEKNS
ncbi:DUF4162 domain-containing protein [Gelria sp. Kuro-4]|uniref:DUF4162 domain-containing protein n=1 Tax=Gelria sp. Kuro-4 TaxID=2796927 RepID=UPI001C7FE4C8|nr:DUF4162 domain-containing protein [Gelria sp. Kuro-4]